MAEATANVEPEVAERIEEDVLPPGPTTKSMAIGEILGSFILAFLGIGVSSAGAVWSTSQSPWYGGSVLPVALGWALTIALGIYVTNTLSGAHFNPSVTLALAVTGRHPWRQVPAYIVYQLIGWFLGAAALMLIVGRGLTAYAQRQGIAFGAPGSQSIASAFTTYSPNPGVSVATSQTVPFYVGFSAEFLATFMLLLVILSLLETRHVNAPSAWFFPLIVGGTVGLLIMIFAPVSSTSLNAARDLGPRFLLWLMGFGSVAFPGPNHGLALVATVLGPSLGGPAGALFFDKVVRPNIPGVEPEREVTTLSQLAYDPTMEVESRRRGTLAGHTTQLPAALLEENDDIDLVMVDIGGCIYDDDPWALAVLKAATEISGSEVSEGEFWRIYDEQRQVQGGSLSRTVADRFVPGGDPDQLTELAKRYADYTTTHIYADARPTLEALATRYKLGAVVNPIDAQTRALRRDGLLEYFDVVTHPAKVDATTPEPRMWEKALEEVGVQANRAVHVGNRMDNDVLPAKEAGLHTIWLLRGEAPPSPTIEQLAEPDAIVTTFGGVPSALVTITASGVR